MKDNVIDYFDYKEDFNTTKTFYSDSIKNPILEGFYTLGIDEAGRGPVLGPMVYACCFWNDSLDKEINNDYKFDDSKKLSDKVRRNIFERMKNDKRLFFIVNIITPEFLSKNMVRRDENIINLNYMSFNSAIELMNDPIRKGFNIVNVYADTVGPKQKYTEKLKNSCIKSEGINILAEEKADSKYKQVSAASIAAKVTRDEILENWEFIENNGVINFSKEVGVGYPGHPLTKKWVKNNFHNIFGFPTIVRFGWKTAYNVIFKDGKKVTYKDYKYEPSGDTRKKYIKDINNEKLDQINFNKVKEYDYLKKKDIKLQGFSLF